MKVEIYILNPILNCKALKIQCTLISFKVATISLRKYRNSKEIIINLMNLIIQLHPVKLQSLIFKKCWPHNFTNS
jgi:hypothetical protein